MNELFNDFNKFYFRETRVFERVFVAMPDTDYFASDESIT